jgi:hypothetical protein
MNQITTPIVPDVITTTRTATSFTIRCMNLDLFKTASFVASLLDANGNVIDNKFINLTNEQYLAWQNDDTYIVNLVATILGVVPSTPSVPS